MLHWVGQGEAAARVGPGSSAQGAEKGRFHCLPDLIGGCRRIMENVEVYGEDEPVDHLYEVVSGAIRIAKLTSDGRRQISRFCLPGEMFGLEAGGAHAFSAEATTDSAIRLVRRSAIAATAVREPAMLERLWTQTMLQLTRAEDHMLLLGRKHAQERIATFLLDMAKRLSDDDEFELPMSRRDIADYLGLTIETVSRIFTLLEQQRLIAMPTSRHIVIRNPVALRKLNDCIAA
jgi:CRP/FNR family nitrogen fixation transcriptional regulator